MEYLWSHVPSGGGRYLGRGRVSGGYGIEGRVSRKLGIQRVGGRVYPTKFSRFHIISSGFLLKITKFQAFSRDSVIFQGFPGRMVTRIKL